MTFLREINIIEKDCHNKQFILVLQLFIIQNKDIFRTTLE